MAVPRPHLFGQPSALRRTLLQQLCHESLSVVEAAHVTPQALEGALDLLESLAGCHVHSSPDFGWTPEHADSAGNGEWEQEYGRAGKYEGDHRSYLRSEPRPGFTAETGRLKSSLVSDMVDSPASLGLESKTVRLVSYDPAWPGLFAAEQRRLGVILNVEGIALTIEHTGSTSVPGLAAKPILDILAGAPDATSLARAIDTLQRADYIYRGEQGIPGRHFFRRGIPRQYHIHLTLTGSDFWRDHLLFRDHLRANPDVAAEYAALKQELAKRYPFDRESYIEGKTEFVQRILRAASAASE